MMNDCFMDDFPSIFENDHKTSIKHYFCQKKLLFPLVTQKANYWSENQCCAKIARKTVEHHPAIYYVFNS